MQPKVMATLTWHEGTPDGENEVFLLLPDFDFEQQEETVEVLKQSLIQYGVHPTQILFMGRRSWDGKYVFMCQIGRFHKSKNPFVQECDVEIHCSYVLEHRGKIFKPTLDEQPDIIFENLNI